jgi:hypothetical protein
MASTGRGVEAEYESKISLDWMICRSTRQTRQMLNKSPECRLFQEFRRIFLSGWAPDKTRQRPTDGIHHLERPARRRLSSRLGRSALGRWFYLRLPSLRESLDAGADSSTLPILTIASLGGFGAVIAGPSAFAEVRDAMLSTPGRPLISLTVATNGFGGLTGTAPGRLVIALNALGETYVPRD